MFIKPTSFTAYVKVLRDKTCGQGENWKLSTQDCAHALDKIKGVDRLGLFLGRKYIDNWTSGVPIYNFTNVCC